MDEDYVIDWSADEPIMLLDAVIGMDPADGRTIDGAEFAKQLLRLDGMGKKSIQLWINCPGGNVVDGMNIFNAVLKSKTPVDTTNIGLCASMGAAIYMAGRKRFMADYASFMVHNPSGSDDKNASKSFTNALTKMMSKCSLSDTEMQGLMDKTTWISPEDCFKMGICTEEPHKTTDLNKKYMVTAMFEQANKIVNNSLTVKTKNMNFKKIAAHFKLNDEATEDAIMTEVTKMEARVTTAETALQTANQSIKKLKDDLVAETAKGDALAQTITANAEVEKKEKATILVNKHVAKITVDPKTTEGKATIEKWIGLAENDLEGTETILEGLPINKAAKKIEDVVAESKTAGTYTAAARMAEIAARSKK